MLKFEMPSTRLALDFLTISASFSNPLKWHTNSLFQFVIAPADAMRLANPNEISTVNTSIYSASFREVKDVYPVDMKEWIYGRGTVLSWFLIITVLSLFFLSRFFLEFSKLKLKQSLEEINLSKVVLIRKKVQINQKSNPFYKTVFKDYVTVSLDAKGIAGVDYQISTTPKIFLKACWHWLKALLETLSSENSFTLNGVLYKTTAAKWESLSNFSSFVYFHKITVLKNYLKDFDTEVSSFEQVSWCAEIEKELLSEYKLRHIQIGILPFFPYPTIGLDSTFYFRSVKIYNEYKKYFPTREFNKLSVNLDGSLSKKLVCKNSDELKFVFATQPYRKEQEAEIINFLDERYRRKLFIRYHPRDKKTYKNIEYQNLNQNVIIITRCSSIVLECFAYGIPFLSYIDDQDSVLDKNELADDDSPAFVSTLECLEVNLNDIKSYLKNFHKWRCALIKSGTLYDCSDFGVNKNRHK